MLIEGSVKMRQYAERATWIFLMSIAAACAQLPKVQPSNGHIDQSIQQPIENKWVLEEQSPAIKKSGEAFALKNKAKEQTYTIVVNEVSVKEILFALARDSKLNVDISPSISGSVTLNAVNQTLPAILERIARQVSMIYRVENKVLIIEPDNPVFKNYKINYVNMDRDTKGGISVTNQLASTPIGSLGSTSNSNGAQNNSTTAVNSVSSNHFWDSLIKNIEDILRETDKQILINRLDSDVRLQAEFDGQAKSKEPSPAPMNKDKVGAPLDANSMVSTSLSENSEKSLRSYQTLFASKIIANKETGILSIRATQKQHEKIAEFVDLVQGSAKRQVLIEASIVEITLNDQYQAGVDWSRLGNGFTFQQNLLGTTLNNSPSVAIGYKNSTALGDIAASVKMLQTFGQSKVLSSPKLMVLNSQTAILKVVDNLVYFTTTTTTKDPSSNGPSSVTYTTTPSTIPIGIWMSVTPQINENSAVTLNVRPTIARKVGEVQDPNPNLSIPSRIPQIQVREMESMLQVNSGNTVILGGLMQDDISRTDNGVPRLMNLPGFGSLFKSKNDSAKKTELVIFLRPTVIKNASLESDELEDYKQYLPSQQLQKVIDESATQPSQ
jgi:MSHA biogenesis protein MshL